MENYLTQITNYLLTQSWQIAVLVVVIAAVNLALKNRSAHIRYLLWLIVLAKCLVPPLFTVPLAVLSQEKLSEPVLAAYPTRIPAAFEAFDADVAEPPAPSSAPVATPPVPTVTERPVRLTVRQWFGLAWIIGAAGFIIAAVTKTLRTEFWLRRQRKPLRAELQIAIADLFSGLGLKSLPTVWLVEGIGQPFVWGLLRGGIYLPADFVSVDSAEHRRDILGHELSHIIRFDAAVNILQIIAQAIFWLHPFVWWANKRIRAEREKCCDEMAIARLGAKARDYSSAIVNILISEHESNRPVPSLAVAGPVKNIEERIKTMLKPGKKFYKRPNLIAATVVLLLALLTVPTALVLTVRAETQTEETIGERVIEDKVTCTGRVVNAGGEPIDGAKVIAYEMLSDGIAGNILLRQVGEVTTIENGAFAFATIAKPERGVFFECKIVAVKPDLALGWAEWTMREDTQLNIQLGEPTRLEGVIVDNAGKPIAGAEVRANLLRTLEAREGKEKSEWQSLPGIPPFRELITQTNRQGRFLFSNLPADLEVDLLIKAEGKATTYTYLTVGDLDDEGYFEIYLSREQYQQLQSGKAWFEVTVPYTDKRAYMAEDVFAYDLLATDKTKAGVAWIARPNSEPGSVIGRLLFEPKAFNIDLLQTSTHGKIMLACFFDMQQRPSRYFLRELARRAQQLKQKGVTVIAIQASKIDKKALNRWVKNDNIPFAVGMVRGNGEKTKFDWGVQALPWLILADRNRVISAEGFGLGELDEKIEAVAEK